MSRRFNLHKLLMVLCVIPIFIFVFYQFKDGSQLKNLNASNLLWVGMLLLCPLMHLFMMRGMNHGGSSHHSEHHADDQNKKPD